MDQPLYSVAFKVKVVRASEQPGGELAQICQEFGLSEDQVLRWREEYQQWQPTLRGGVRRKLRLLDQHIVV